MSKQVSLSKSKENSLPDRVRRHLWEGLFIMVLAISMLLLLSLITYDPGDPSWSFSGSNDFFANAGGRVGAWFADLFLYIFGYFAYLFPVLVLYPFLHQFRKRYQSVPQNIGISMIRYLGLILILIGGCSIVNMELVNYEATLPYTAGGVMGNAVENNLTLAFNQFGAMLFSWALLLTGITFATGISWMKVLHALGRGVGCSTIWAFNFIRQLREKMIPLCQTLYQKIKPAKKTNIVHRPATIFKPQQVTKPKPKKLVIKEKEPDIVMPAKAVNQQSEIPQFSTDEGIPSLNLLDRVKRSGAYSGFSDADLESISTELEQRLLDFGVKAEVVGVQPGPVVTRFELRLAPGVKASKLTGLAKDLARSLSISRVRVVEIIPGKPVVGLELPNKHREIVRLSEVLETEQYEKARSLLSLALGVDIAGHPVIVDLGKMPHLLVAGTTGSGKSVGLNAMLLSLLFKATPNEVRLILVDPKMLELSVYEDIPHLLTPVVTDMKEAANALRWAVMEMERRYRLMATLKVRNILNYNNKIKEANKKGKPLTDPLWQSQNPDEQAPILQTLPYVVIVIDELADMMMVVGKKVEQLIARIAQKARAAGIHLILATQRPSVDVLTGLIKSNVPTRISFQVSSKIDSRTILDQQGAEQLLGHGDMLYLAPGTGTPVRVHGAFIDDSEVQQVTDEWRRKGKPVYMDDILHSTQENQDGFGGSELSSNLEDADPLYDEAVAFVVETRKASISSVQRKLKIGYNRAARLIEEMERTGIVSAMESNGAREVLVPASAER